MAQKDNTRPGARVAPDVQQEMNQLGAILHELNIIPEQKAKALSAPADRSEIPMALRDQGIDDEAITQAFYMRFKNRGFSLFDPSKHLDDSAVRAGPREGDWLICKGVCWIVNPYDEKALGHTRQAKTANSGDKRYQWGTYGVISPAAYQNASQLIGVDLALDAGDDSANGAAEQEAERLFSQIMETACSRLASDIHLNPGKQVNIKMRIDGRLVNIRTVPLDATYTRFCNLLMSKCTKEATYNLPVSGEFRYTYNDKVASVRLEMCPAKTEQRVAPRFTLRVNGLNTNNKALGTLGFSKTHLTTLRHFSKMPMGLVLVTGPTGSGKSTTLYALLQDIAMHSPFNSIFTLEDPVEQIIPQFQQIEIRGQMTFGAGLKSLLRQDPDVMLVGEIRDEETATLALKGANTGHLVLSTLHTNNSHACIGRMIDLGCDRSTLAEALKGVTAQRMVDIVCPHCSEKIPLHDVPEYRDSYATLPIWKPDQMIRVAKKGGCDQCNRIGYRGRHPVQEIFVMDALAKEMISRAAIPSQIRTAQIEAGSFDTIWMDGYRLVAAGVTTFDALERRLDIDEALVTKDTVAAIVKKSSTAMQPAAGGVNTSTVQIGTGARAISSLPMR